MKKIISLFLALSLIIASFTGCSPEAKSYFDNVKEATKIRVYDQFSTADYTINLAPFKDYFLMNFSPETMADATYNEKIMYDKFMKALESYPEIKAHVTVYAKADNTDINQPLMAADYQITLELFGNVYKSENMSVFVDKTKFIFSKNIYKFMKEVAVGLTHQFVPEVEKENTLNAIDSTYNDIYNNMNEYLLVDYSEYRNELNVSEQEYLNSGQALQLVDFYLEKLAGMDIDLPFTAENEKYTLTMTLSEFIDKLPEFLAALDKLDFNEEINTAIDEMVKEIDFNDNDVQMAMSMAKSMLEGSEFTISNSFKDDKYIDEFALTINYQGKRAFDFKTYSRTEKVKEVSIQLPKLEQMTNINDFMEEFEEKYEPVTSNEDISAIYQERVVNFNGEQKNMAVYNIHGNTFFKLRDLATLLNGSEKQFAIDLIADSNIIALTPDMPYEVTDAATNVTDVDMYKPVVVPSSYVLMVNGQNADVEVYNINGSNYYMLRDLAAYLNFSVDYSQELGIMIDTSKDFQ